MSQEEREREFFQRLLALTKQYGVTEIGSCGCCGGVRVNWEGVQYDNVEVNKNGLCASRYDIQAKTYNGSQKLT